MTGETKKVSITKEELSFFFDCLKPFWGWLSALFLVTICIAISHTLSPYALKELINVIDNTHISTHLLDLGGVAGFYLLASLFPVIIYRIHNYISINLSPPLRHYISLMTMKQMMAHPCRYFSQYSVGNFENAVKEIVQTIPILIKTVFDSFVCGIMTLGIAMLAVGSIDSKFSIGLFLWITVFIIGSIITLKHAKQLGNDGMIARSRMIGKIVEILENIKCIQLFTREDYEHKHLEKLSSDYEQIDREKEKCNVKTFGFQGFSFLIYQTVCLYWLIEGLKANQISLGDFALVLTINFSFVDYFRKVSRDIVVIADNIGALQEGILLVLGEKRQNLETDKKNIDSFTGDITFDKISFHYDEALPLFQNLSVYIPAGKKVAIVGYSGSGKSTFINLILRLYQAKTGKIFLDKNEMDAISEKSLRNAISVVPQAPSLFTGTMMDNIKYGKLEASDEEAIEAAKRAEIHTFISELPLGYHTRVDGAGVKISAGQKQRIAIARAFLKNSSILILDEAMSHLDSVTEQKILETLFAYYKDKTILIITHDISFLSSKVDSIMVFDRGQLIENGTHSELLVKQGLYAQLLGKEGYSGLSSSAIIGPHT